MEIDCIPTSLELFSGPLQETGIEEIFIENILPTSGVINDTTLEFTLPSEASHYIDLSSVRLYVRVQVTQKDGKPIDKDDVKLIPLWPQAMFRQVDIYLGGKCVSSSTNTYSYRAFFETFLSYNPHVKNELLETTEHYSGTRVKSGEVYEAYSSLHLDLSGQDKLLVNSVPIKIRLLRNNDDFLFQQQATDGASYKIVIEKLSLYVRKVLPTATVLLDHANRLATENIRYHIDRVFMKSFTLNSGVADHTISNAYLGQLPNRLIIGMVDSKAFNASPTKNPFHFEHFNLTHASIVTDARMVPAGGYEPDFEKGLICREYVGLLQTLLGGCLKQDSIGLTKEDFVKNGKTFLGFTLPSAIEGTSDLALPPRQTGYINIRLRFKEALKSSVTLICYAEFDNIIEVDGLRNVYTDFNA
jgi:hypothetical protein